MKVWELREKRHPPLNFAKFCQLHFFLNEDSRLQGAVKCEDAFKGRPPLNSCTFKSLVTIEVSILVTQDVVDLILSDPISNFAYCILPRWFFIFFERGAL